MLMATVLHTLLNYLIKILLHTFLVISRLKLETPLEGSLLESLKNLIRAVGLEVIEVCLLKHKDRKHPTRKSRQYFACLQMLQDCGHHFRAGDVFPHTVYQFNEYHSGLTHVECVPDSFRVFNIVQLLIKVHFLSLLGTLFLSHVLWS